MNNQRSFFYLWPIITLLAVMIYKNYLIGYQGLIALNLIKDFLLFLFVAFLSIQRESKGWRLISLLIIWLFIIVNWVDTSVYIALHERLTLNNALGNYRYLDTVKYFISTQLIIFTLVVFLLPVVLRKRLISIPMQVSSVAYGILQAIFALGICFFWFNSKATIPDAGGDAISLTNNSYTATSVSPESLEFVTRNYTDFIKRIEAYFNGEAWIKPVDTTLKRPNIVIVISESLSSVDSKYSGGLFNRLPKIDQILQEGLVLNHAVSNGKITMHGLSAFLLGIQTTTSGGYSGMMDQFPPSQFKENNLVDYANKNGYNTVVVSPSQPVTFEQIIAWFKAIGFQAIYDIDNPVFKDSPRFAWNAPSDAAIFQFSNSLIPSLKEPYLLVIETVSLHQPYILPNAQYRIGNNDLLNQVNYVDNTTYDFYQNIKKQGVLKNGYFIFFGDHRRFEPLEPEEVSNGGYGEWHERIVCGLVGKDIPSHWISSMPFSLVDMNILLHHLIEGSPFNAETLAQSNLSTVFKVNIPFSISLVKDNGTYLIRTEKYAPLFITLFGTIPFEKIPGEVYQVAVSYLIKNYQQMDTKLKAVKTGS